MHIVLLSLCVTLVVCYSRCVLLSLVQFEETDDAELLLELDPAHPAPAEAQFVTLSDGSTALVVCHCCTFVATAHCSLLTGSC